MSKEEDLIAYLDRIWTEDGNVFITVKTVEEDYKVLPVVNWGARKDALVERIFALKSRGLEVYYSPAMYEANSPTKEKKYVSGSKTLWVDFDGNATEIYETILSGLLPMPLPTIRIQSGQPGHEHWYWHLDEVYPIELFEVLNERITYYLGADKACWNADRVLRPPYTQNNKPKYKNDPLFPLQVIIVEDTGKVYAPIDFKDIPAIKKSQGVEIESLKELGALPSVADILGRYKWDGETLDLFIEPGPLMGKDADGKPKSKRDEAMFLIAMHCAEIGMPDAAIYVAVEAFDTKVGKFVGRRDREKQLLNFVAKARAKYPESITTGNVYVDEDIKVVYTLNELLDSEFHLDWLIDDFIPKGTINFISAESGIGKSRLSLQLAYACAAGSKFLRWDLNKAYKAMYISLEMDGNMLKHFVQGLMKGKERADSISDNLLLIPVGEAIDLENDEFIEMMIKQYAPDIVFIDALGSLTFEEIGEKVAKNINNKLKSILKKYGTTFVIIHHNRKESAQASKSEPKLGDIYGSQYVVTDAAVAITLNRVDDDHIQMTQVKTRAVDQSKKSTKLKSTGQFEFSVAEDDDIEDILSGNSSKDFEDVGTGSFFTTYKGS